MSRVDDRWAADAVLFAREALGFHPDASQARILTSNNSRGLLNCSRQWGKSTVTALKAVHHAFFETGSMVLIVSPSERQSREFLRKAKAFVRRLGLPVRGDGDNEASLQLPNGSRMVGVPSREDTVRGFSAVSLILVDEAARVPDEMYQSVRPMLAVGDGSLWLMSTPYGKRGFFWEAWDHGKEPWERISVPAAECPRISKKFLANERLALGERAYAQDYLCEFTDTEDQIFKDEYIRKAFTPGLKPLCFD